MVSPRRRAVIEFVLDNLVWFILVVVLALFSLTVPNYFQIGIFANIIEQSTFVGIMAIGLVARSSSPATWTSRSNRSWRWRR